MYNINNQPIHNVKTTIYIAKKLGTVQDKDLNQMEVYAEPIKYRFNIQGLNESSDIQEFGENINNMKVAIIPEKKKYMNKFTEFDKAYLYSTPEDEVTNGINADYRIYAIRPQNTCIRIYFKRLVK